MSGFVGVRNREEPVTDELLARLWQPIAHRGPDSEGRWAQGTLGVAAGALRVTPESAEEEQPFRHRSGVIAALDGRLDNRDELLAFLPDAKAGDPDVALVAEAYVIWGDRFPGRLNGEYALAVLDPSSRRVLLARDVVGTRSLVFSETSAGDVLFGSEAKALFADPSVPSAPNLDVVAEYLLGGNARATPWDSYFAFVRCVPPGVTVLVHDAGITWRTHDSFDLGGRTIHREYGTYIEEYRERFTDAVMRRLRSAHPVGFFVSGGLDSSSIFAVAAKQGGRPDLIPVNLSFPSGSPGDEEPYVRELELELDHEIHRVTALSDALVPAAFAQTFVLEAPSSPPGWESRRAMWELMRLHGARACLGGSWGDQVLVDQSYLVDLFDSLRWVEAWRHLSSYPEWMTDVDRTSFRRTFLEDLVRWHVPQRMAGMARALRTSVRGVRYDHRWYGQELRARARSEALRPAIGGWSRVPARPRSLLSRLRSLSAGLSIPWNASGAASVGLDDRSPFLDRDLIAYVMSVPGDVVARGGAVRGLHRDAMAGILPEMIRNRRNKGDATSFANAMTADAMPSVAELFSDASLAGTMGLVHAGAVASGVEALQSGIRLAADSGEAARMRRIVALEAWLQVFRSEGPKGETGND